MALKKYDRLCATLGSRLSRQSNRNIPSTIFPKVFYSDSNMMGYVVAGCLLVKKVICTVYHLFPHHHLCQEQQNVTAPEVQRQQNEAHISDWILVVSSLLLWHQWMKQPTIAKKQIKGSHVAVQWLMHLMATVTPCTTGVTNNTIKKHLVLHLSKTFSTMVYLPM